MLEIIDKQQVVILESDWQKMNAKTDNSFDFLQIYGKISCGDFKLINSEIEGYLKIPERMLGGKECFVLRASGDSMIGAGIEEGDLLIVEKCLCPDNGDIAVILSDSPEELVVLKRFFNLGNNRYLLRPENAKYHERIVSNCAVIGRAIKIIKNI